MNSFWHIVSSIPVNDNREARAASFSATLDSLPPEEYLSFLTGFRREFGSLTANVDLANAIYLFYEGCFSNDLFDYFCYWAISLGQKHLQEILLSPDKILDFEHIFGLPDFEELGRAVWGRANRENISWDGTYNSLPKDWLYEDSKQQDLFPRLYDWCQDV